MRRPRCADARCASGSRADCLHAGTLFRGCVAASERATESARCTLMSLLIGRHAKSNYCAHLTTACQTLARFVNGRTQDSQERRGRFEPSWAWVRLGVGHKNGVVHNVDCVRRPNSLLPSVRQVSTCWVVVGRTEAVACSVWYGRSALSPSVVITVVWYVARRQDANWTKARRLPCAFEAPLTTLSAPLPTAAVGVSTAEDACDGSRVLAATTSLARHADFLRSFRLARARANNVFAGWHRTAEPSMIQGVSRLAAATGPAGFAIPASRRRRAPIAVSIEHRYCLIDCFLGQRAWRRVVSRWATWPF